ncbi:MAG: hypothetical protein K0S81_3721, partial [Rhodospirillales bacterium]|nr:hypothetical protein [Rhodospirillales bacterium]
CGFAHATAGHFACFCTAVNWLPRRIRMESAALPFSVPLMVAAVHKSKEAEHD